MRTILALTSAVILYASGALAQDAATNYGSLQDGLPPFQSKPVAPQPRHNLSRP